MSQIRSAGLELTQVNAGLRSLLAFEVFLMISTRLAGSILPLSFQQTLTLPPLPPRSAHRAGTPSEAAADQPPTDALLGVEAEEVVAVAQAADLGL